MRPTPARERVPLLAAGLASVTGSLVFLVTSPVDQGALAFATRLRDHVDLGNLEGEIARVAFETVRPASASVWLRHGRTPSPGRVS